MRVKTILALVFFIGLSGMAAGNSPVKEQKLVGDKAPQFSIEDINGEKISLEGLLDKYNIIVVNFWGLRCGACIQEMPHLNNIYKEFKSDLRILGVNVDAVDGGFLQDKMGKLGLKIDYDVVPDPGFMMVELFQMTAAPLTIVIDSSGIVRYRHENYEPGDEVELEELIKSILEESKIVNK